MSLTEEQQKLEAGREENSRPVSPLTPMSPLMVGIKAKCPSCYDGPLFQGILSVQDKCPTCGFDLKDADPGDGPAVFVILIMGAISTAILLFMEFSLGVPAWVHFVTQPILVTGGSIWMLRVLKGWILAMQYRHDAHEGRVEEQRDTEQNTQ